MLLDETYLDLFARLGILIGVSLDGGQAVHDRNRVFPNGHGSFTAVARGLRLLNEPQYRSVYSGMLCTVNIENDPLDVYQSLMEFEPPHMDLLLPHGNWNSPPPNWPTDPEDTPYANWLIPIFDAWYRTKPQRTSIRLFESLIDLLLGGPTRSEAVGLGPDGLVVIECDGSIEQTDVLKTTVEGGSATGLHLQTATLDEVNAHPVFRTRHAGLAGLSAMCQACPIVRVCGGGLYAHRFRSDNGFDNPSVYCRNLATLIEHIQRRIDADLIRMGQPVSSVRRQCSAYDS